MTRKNHTPPVISLIKGGLGNQMFCYAAGRALALRFGRPLLLDVHTGFQRDGYGRRYRLDRFPINAAEASQVESLGGDTRAFSHRIARMASKLRHPGKRSYLLEKNGCTPEMLRKLTPSERQFLYLNGYWQDEEYFRDAADRVRKELAPPVPISTAGLEARKAILSSAEPVMVHVRRERYNPRLDEKYYNDCIAACLTIFPAATFYVFGDDFAWTKEHLIFEGASVRYLDRVGADEIEDLHLMTCCRHAILANSSFSWWGAWLGHHAQQLVWTPANPGWPVKPAAGWVQIPNELEYV